MCKFERKGKVPLHVPRLREVAVKVYGQWTLLSSGERRLNISDDDIPF